MARYYFRQIWSIDNPQNCRYFHGTNISRTVQFDQRLIIRLIVPVISLWTKKFTSSFANPNKMSIFAILFQKQASKPWRGGRVVDYGSLENCWAERLRGFESLPLRKRKRKSASSSLESWFSFSFATPRRRRGRDVGQRPKSRRERDSRKAVSFK